MSNRVGWSKSAGEGSLQSIVICRRTEILVLNVPSGLAIQLGLGVGFLGEMLDEHFLGGARMS